jgi:hypothetical protein
MVDRSGFVKRRSANRIQIMDQLEQLGLGLES